jgi:hypothetical protein
MRSRTLFIVTLTAALGLCATSALADPTVLFGNTLTRSTEGRAPIKYYLDADHTYRIVLPGGASVAGTWTEADGQLCLTTTSPEALPPACGPLVTGQVGDSWSRTAADGQTMVYTIVAGRPS